MSYNILFEKYCTRQLYGYCPSWALRWDYRKGEILKEIIQYRADIVSLQVSLFVCDALYRKVEMLLSCYKVIFHQSIQDAIQLFCAISNFVYPNFCMLEFFSLL